MAFGVSIWNGMTAASHLVLIASAALLLNEILFLTGNTALRTRVLTRPNTRWAIYLPLVALVTERSYYVLARIVAGRGLNLWTLHPVPELLSAMVAASLFAAWCILMIAALGNVATVRWMIFRFAALLSALWVAITVLLAALR